MAAIAYSDLGAMLWVLDPSISETVYQYLVPVKSMPATGSAPSQIEVTELDSPKKQYILDRQDVPMFEFNYNYTVTNFTRVKSFLDGSSTYKFMITYLDKSGVIFEGIGATFINEVSAGNAIEAQMAIAVTSTTELSDCSAKVNASSVPIGKKNPFSSATTIVLGALPDRTVVHGNTLIINIETDPEDTTIVATSGDITAATVDVTAKEITITGVTAGDAIISVTASKDGYTSASDKFIITVT